MIVGLGRGFDRLIAILAGATLTALLLDVTLGIVTRAVNDPLIWTDEGARFLMIWLGVFGWVLATRRQSHVRIRFFQALLPGRGQANTEILIQLGMIVLGIAVTVLGWTLVRRNLDLMATTLPLSIAWMYLPLILAGAVTATQAIVDLHGLRRNNRTDASPIGESDLE